MAAGCRGGGNEAAQAAEWLAGLDHAGRAAQTILAATNLPDRDAAARLGSDSTLRRLGGLWIESGDARAVAQLARTLATTERPPVLLGSDLTEGVGAVIAGGTAFPPMFRVLSTLEDRELRDLGRLVAEEASEIGLSLALVRGPPFGGGIDYLDVPWDELDGRFAAYARGLVGERLLPAAGILWPQAVTMDLPRWDRSRLEAVELPLLRAARTAGFSALALGPSPVISLTGDTLPIFTSSSALGGLLRREVGWEGLVIADLRAMGAEEPEHGAAAAIAAGADLLITRREPAVVVEELTSAVRNGELSGERLQDAALRVLTAKATLRGAPPVAAPDSIRIPRDPAAARRSSDLAAERLVVRFSTPSPASTSGGVLVLSPAGRGDAFVRELESRLPVTFVPLNFADDTLSVRSAVADAVAAAGAVVYLDFADPGSSLLHRLVQSLPESIHGDRRIARVAFRSTAEPALIEEPPAVLAWGSGPSSQAAAARSLLEAPAVGPSPGPIAGVVRTVPATDVGMNPARLAAADRAIETALQRGTFTAAALAVGRRGGLVRFRGYGSLEGDLPVDPDSTIFDLASLTKVLATTSATLVLVDRGVIQLDAPVQRYVPEFVGDGKGAVTVRHLLAHTSGLPPGLGLYAAMPSREAALARVFRQALRRPPGEQAEYSDLGMIVLAEVIERASGKSLDRLLTEEVFLPLNLSSTMFLPPEPLRPRVVPTAVRSERPYILHGVVHDGNAFRLEGIAGHAGLFSTLRDVTVLTQTVLNGGAYGGVRVFADSTTRAFGRRQPGAAERALGWDTPGARSSAGLYFSADSFGHTGYTGTSIWIDPRKELFVVLLTNRTFSEATAEAILGVRRAVHDAVAQAITDEPVARRPGAR